MAPVIRIDDEVWKKLQEQAEALVDTPNDVLRRLLELNNTKSENPGSSAKEMNMQSQRVGNQIDSIFIVVNAAGSKPDESNAIAGKELTEQRVNSGVDIQAFRRFGRARKILKSGTRIVMHQGGSQNWRDQYGAGTLRAAGRVKAVGLPLTEEDKNSPDYKLTKTFYPAKPLAGKALYNFPKGLANRPLPKEDLPYNPGRGDNFIEVRPDDPRYEILNQWWLANY